MADAKDSVLDFVSDEVVVVKKAAKKIVKKVKKAVKKTPVKKAAKKSKPSCSATSPAKASPRPGRTSPRRSKTKKSWSSTRSSEPCLHKALGPTWAWVWTMIHSGAAGRRPRCRRVGSAVQGSARVTACGPSGLTARSPCAPRLLPRASIELVSRNRCRPVATSFGTTQTMRFQVTLARARADIGALSRCSGCAPSPVGFGADRRGCTPGSFLTGPQAYAWILSSFNGEPSAASAWLAEAA